MVFMVPAFAAMRDEIAKSFLCRFQITRIQSLTKSSKPLAATVTGRC